MGDHQRPAGKLGAELLRREKGDRAQVPRAVAAAGDLCEPPKPEFAGSPVGRRHQRIEPPEGGARQHQQLPPHRSGPEASTARG